jgi:hypothetical protein
MQLSHESTLGGYIKPDTDEEKLYGSYFLKESWQIDQFAALMYGLTLERFKYLNEHPAEAYASEDLKAVLAANKMKKLFWKTWAN